MVVILKNEVVVITGASAGLGRAIAREFGKYGAKIGLIARGSRDSKPRSRRSNLWVEEPWCFRRTSPMRRPAEKAAATVEQEFGPIDVWVNNAMAFVF
jgi:NAD(P)-dependent dehydrogenase (short-subunit alcohol dehydrogenase family)